MPVPFGFSVGDFITTINLFKDLVLALQDQGGSSSDFQRTIIDLETIAGILLELQSLQPVNNDCSHVNSIRAQAHRTYHSVQQFLCSIEKFNDKLGPRSARGFHRGVLAKIKWSQCVATKFKELRETVHLQSTNIQTLLSLLIQHNQTVDRALFTTTFAKHSLAIESLAIHVKSIETALRQHRQTKESQAIRAFENSSETSEAGVDGTSTENHDGRDGVASHAPVACPSLDSASAEDTPKALPAQSLHGNQAVFSGIGKLEGPICTSSPHNGLPSANPPTLPSNRPGLHPQMILSQELVADTLLAIFSYLALTGNTVQQVARSLLRSLKMFLLSLPRVLVFLRLLRQVPRTVSLILEDNIRFEDALGRMQSLQYQHFRHWTVFEAYLCCTFNNTPGMQKVLQRQFVLKCKSVREEALDATNWEKYASPGMVVTMSISISTTLIPSGHCPMGCVAKTMKISDSEVCCTQCDLTFSVRRPPQSDILRAVKFMGTRSRPLALRGIRQRKRHETDTAKPKEQEKRKRRESVESRLRAQLKIDKTGVLNLLRYESCHKEEEAHRLEVQELTHFKRVHLVEDTVLKWTWIFNRADKPWYWGWYVELPEVRAEWKRAEFWEQISPGLTNSVIRDLIFDEGALAGKDHISESNYEFCRQILASEAARERAAQFSLDAPQTPSSFKRTYTLTYTGSLSVSESGLCTAKIPFIHLLATKPLMPSQIRRYLGLPKLESDQLLAIFARDCPSDPDKKELQEISYRELDVWGFPYHKQSVRQAAIDRSIQAFDILRIDQQDNLWQTLLPPEQRGKRICLSRRNTG